LTWVNSPARFLHANCTREQSSQRAASQRRGTASGDSSHEIE